MSMYHHLRIARPVNDLARTRTMYARGLGLQLLASFRDHEGFDGVMLGKPGEQHHFEFTQCRRHAVRPSPTHEDLLVFYITEPTEWRTACADMETAGFRPVASFNPYWDVHGRTFEDPDGYRVVLQNASWLP